MQNLLKRGCGQQNVQPMPVQKRVAARPDKIVVTKSGTNSQPVGPLQAFHGEARRLRSLWSGVPHGGGGSPPLLPNPAGIRSRIKRQQSVFPFFLALPALNQSHFPCNLVGFPLVLHSPSPLVDLRAVDSVGPKSSTPVVHGRDEDGNQIRSPTMTVKPAPGKAGHRFRWRACGGTTTRR